MTCRVIICRPQPGADATALCAQGMGLEPCIHPLFTVEPMPWTPPGPASFDALMLTSANAVRHGGPALEAFNGLPVFAVGDATAELASAEGFREVNIAGPDAQALAEAIAQTGHERILHLCGEDRRPFDPGVLRVTHVPVYRSAEAGDAKGLTALIQPGDIMLVHSPRAGRRIAALIPPDLRHRLSIAAISPAALSAAGTGWERAVAADEPRDAAILALALQICQKDAVAPSGGSEGSGMNNEFPAVEPPAYPPPPQRPRSRGTLTLLLLALAFAGGIIAALWAAPAIKNWWQPGAETGDSADNASGLGLMDDEGNTSAPTARSALTAQNVEALEARLAALSTKLDSISEQAAGAGGNAARAEGLLIAFATRRALDRGTPLGYLEGELRLRFGDAQPRAVATIITAASNPVTLADLQSGLDDVTPVLLGTGGRTDWWTATKRELSNLVILRKADAPSPVPQKTVERARLMLSASRVDAALKEIERLPNHERADNWLQMARQYNEARRALDVVEAAAILEPRSVPVSPRGGGPTNMQVAPPPPTATVENPARR